jgi:hypothetical protein
MGIKVHLIASDLDSDLILEGMIMKTHLTLLALVVTLSVTAGVFCLDKTAAESGDDHRQVVALMAVSHEEWAIIQSEWAHPRGGRITDRMEDRAGGRLDRLPQRITLNIETISDSHVVFRISSRDAPLLNQFAAATADFIEMLRREQADSRMREILRLSDGIHELIRGDTGRLAEARAHRTWAALLIERELARRLQSSVSNASPASGATGVRNIRDDEDRTSTQAATSRATSKIQMQVDVCDLKRAWMEEVAGWDSRTDQISGRISRYLLQLALLEHEVHLLELERERPALIYP